MRDLAFRIALCAVVALLACAGPVAAADQTTIGAGNGAAMMLGASSPLVKSAKAFLLHEVAAIANPALRDATRDAIANDATCLRHRAGLDFERKTAILEQLKAAGLIAPEDDARIPGGVLAGVFPPLKNDGGEWPLLAQT